MKRILIIGASGAIGAALADTYHGKGWHCAGLSRKAQGLDFTQEQTIAAAMATVTGPFDTIVVATGALTLDGVGPEKTICLLYTSPSPRDRTRSRMPSSA